MFGYFTYRAIEWRLNFGNRSSSLGDNGGGRILADTPPAPTECVTRQTPMGRGLIDHQQGEERLKFHPLSPGCVTPTPTA